MNASPNELTEWLDTSPITRSLSWWHFVRDAETMNGRPRVITWTHGSINEKSAVKQTVIRTTRPSWESFKPLYNVCATLWQSQLQGHGKNVARMIVEHRRMAYVHGLEKEIDDDQVKSESRRQTTQERLDSSKDCGYNARHIRALSINYSLHIQQVHTVLVGVAKGSGQDAEGGNQVKNSHSKDDPITMTETAQKLATTTDQEEPMMGRIRARRNNAVSH